MKLWAISDLHVGHPRNRNALEEIPPHPGDWLIIAGDIGERFDHFRFAFDHLAPRFERLVWAPGNHDLWSPAGADDHLRGEHRYRQLIELCREYGVLTPEDPYAVWPGDGPATVIAPLMVLYDYTFRPDHVSPQDAVEWAAASGIRCADEHYLHPDPHESRSAWCRARVAHTEARLGEIPDDHRTVLVNHFPLLQDHARLPRIPRFMVWCGTRLTADWHRRFRAEVVVTGHLHIRATRFTDGVRFEEVSLGYPRQWDPERGPAHYLREILPGGGVPEGETVWR